MTNLEPDHERIQTKLQQLENLKDIIGEQTYLEARWELASQLQDRPPEPAVPARPGVTRSMNLQSVYTDLDVVSPLKPEGSEEKVDPRWMGLRLERGEGGSESPCRNRAAPELEEIELPKIGWVHILTGSIPWRRNWAKPARSECFRPGSAHIGCTIWAAKSGNGPPANGS
jgi:hypothetical protein